MSSDRDRQTEALVFLADVFADLDAYGTAHVVARRGEDGSYAIARVPPDRVTIDTDGFRPEFVPFGKSQTNP